MDLVQIARRNSDPSKFDVVATDEKIEGPIRTLESPFIIRVDPDAHYNEKMIHINMRLHEPVNAYEIGGGMTVQGDGKICLRDYAVMGYVIQEGFVERALKVENRKEIELRANFF